LNIDYFDNSGRDLYLIIDSDLHTGQFKKQSERAFNFRSNKQKGKSYILQKSCLENYYHPRAFEREYDFKKDSFPNIAPNSDVKSLIKEFRRNQDIKANIKMKNNFDVFEQMTKQEWASVVEPELVEFLKKVIS
jgi:hypothetical protein